MRPVKSGIVTPRIRLGLAAFAAVAATGVLASCGGRAPNATSHAALTAPPSSPAPPPSTATPIPPPPEPPTTLVATLRTTLPASVTPGARPVSEVPASWYGYPSVLPVISRVPGWVEVREAQRPNESTAWVPAADVSLSTDPYRLVVSLTTKHLQLFFHGYPVLDVPAGIGTPATPTVTGHFFITMKAPPPSPGYGPFVLATSAHSDTITDWEGLGDAIVAIHGPIDPAADRLIGTTGARVSNGCIRLHIADLVRLAAIPPGTPLDIIN